MNTIDKEELRKLIEAIQSGSIERHDLDAFIPALGLNIACNRAHAAYNGFLDAAKGFHEELLPEWDWGVGFDKGEATAGVALNASDGGFIEGRANNPARAWLIAILKAVEASK
jgi:hypothetical protein